MSLMIQSGRSGGVRIVPARARSRAVRARAAAIGTTGFSHRGRGGEGRPGRGLSFGGILRGIGKAVGTFVPGVGTATDFASTLLTRRAAPTSLANPCGAGFTQDASGNCVRRVAIPFAPRSAPPPATPTAAGSIGDAVVGAFGLPAMVPATVGQITRNDGIVSPILRCGRGMVLGRDNLCYPKAILSRRSKFRKHRLPSRAPVTAGDAAAIRRAERTRDRVKGLAKDVGFKVSKR